MAFDFSKFSDHDKGTAVEIIGSLYHEPDLVIASEDGTPYLYRWFVIPRARERNVYFHVQVADDPDRGLHDHPWDNMSVILAGGYIERLQHLPPYGPANDYTRKAGDTIYRKAEWAHRLFLPRYAPYTMTLFSTGPNVRKWGFWLGDKWFRYEDVTKMENGRSIWTGPTHADMERPHDK